MVRTLATLAKCRSRCGDSSFLSHELLWKINLYVSLARSQAPSPLSPAFEERRSCPIQKLPPRLGVRPRLVRKYQQQFPIRAPQRRTIIGDRITIGEMK